MLESRRARILTKLALNVAGGEPIGDGSDAAGPEPSLIPNVVRLTKKKDPRTSLTKKASREPARNAPTNPSLWSQAVSEAKKRFTVYPSAYANGWAAKWYKERGGGWEKEKQAEATAKKDVGHGGLDEWFSGHGKDKGRARWGDWVAISPIRKQLKSGRVVSPGSIVGQCGISDSPDWKGYTKGGQDPLKCMPRQKAEAMSQEQRASLAKGKARAERASANTGKPVMTRTFSKSAGAGSPLHRLIKQAARFPDAPAVDGVPQESGYSYDPRTQHDVGTNLTPAARKILEHRSVLASMGRPTSINLKNYLTAKYERVPGGAQEVVRQANQAGSPAMWGNLNRNVPITQTPFPSFMGSAVGAYVAGPRASREGIHYERRDAIKDPSTLEHEVNHALNLHLRTNPAVSDPDGGALPARKRPAGVGKRHFDYATQLSEVMAEGASRLKGMLANERGYVPYNRDQMKAEAGATLGSPPYTPRQPAAGDRMSLDVANPEVRRKHLFPSQSFLWYPSRGGEQPALLDTLKRYPDMLRQTL